MRVLGLDPGTERSGWGVVERDDAAWRRLASGIVRLGSGDLPARLVRLHTELERILTAYRPDGCAIEGLFHHRNARSALLLGHARGVCLLVAAAHGVPVTEYAPARVKNALVGHGAAGKEQVAAMVGRLLGFQSAATHDETDALALAICHLEAERPLRLVE
jgi:crossover junction endodeoxyribonuclease RuvC